MNFFLDTGVFFGMCDDKDQWHACCSDFSSKHLGSKNYYTTSEVKTELNKKRAKRRKSWERGDSLRTMEQKLTIWIMNSKIVDYDGHHHYALVLQAVRSILPKTPDDKIVSNAMIWSYDLDLGKPTLVTVDRRDIVQNEKNFKTQVSLAIKRNVPLVIRHADQITS